MFRNPPAYKQSPQQQKSTRRNFKRNRWFELCQSVSNWPITFGFLTVYCVWLLVFACVCAIRFFRRPFEIKKHTHTHQMLNIPIYTNLAQFTIISMLFIVCLASHSFYFHSKTETGSSIFPHLKAFDFIKWIVASKYVRIKKTHSQAQHANRTNSSVL